MFIVRTAAEVNALAPAHAAVHCTILWLRQSTCLTLPCPGSLTFLPQILLFLAMSLQLFEGLHYATKRIRVENQALLRSPQLNLW